MKFNRKQAELQKSDKDSNNSSEQPSQDQQEDQRGDDDQSTDGRQESITHSQKAIRDASVREGIWIQSLIFHQMSETIEV